jgi:hypothetical protein
MLIHGAAPFTGERSRAGYRLNKLTSRTACGGATGAPCSSTAATSTWC